MKKVQGEIKIQKKKYPYSLESKKDGSVFLECPAAKISQSFLPEDIAAVLIDLPELILSEKKYSNKSSEVIQFRVSPDVKNKIEKKALKNGYDSVSSYLRDNLLAI